jgi:hypothetical protein
MNHQSNALLIEMVDQALSLLGFPPLPADVRRGWSEMLTIQMPIHPSVIRHFGLTFVDASTKYSVDGYVMHFEPGRRAETEQEMGKRQLTFEEFLDRYIDFTAFPAGDDELTLWREVSAGIFAARRKLDAVARRYAEHVVATIGETVPAVSTGDELGALAGRLTTPAPRLDGVSPDTAFPGWSYPPREGPDGWELTCAVNFTADALSGENGRRPFVVGHVKTHLASGRAPHVSAVSGAYVG